MNVENVVIVINKTRLEMLIEQFNTLAQARFYIEHSGGNFKDYEKEHQRFKSALEKVQTTIGGELKMKVLQREFLPNYLFGKKDLIVVLGQDGLVANTAKYAKGLPQR